MFEPGQLPGRRPGQAQRFDNRPHPARRPLPSARHLLARPRPSRFAWPGRGPPASSWPSRRGPGRKATALSTWAFASTSTAISSSARSTSRSLIHSVNAWIWAPAFASRAYAPIRGAASHRHRRGPPPRWLPRPSSSGCIRAIEPYPSRRLRPGSGPVLRPATTERPRGRAARIAAQVFDATLPVAFAAGPDDLFPYPSRDQAVEQTPDPSQGLLARGRQPEGAERPRPLHGVASVRRPWRWSRSIAFSMSRVGMPSQGSQA